MWNDVITAPKEGAEVIIVDINNNLVAPVYYSKKRDLFLCSQGSLRNFMIAKWAYKKEFMKQLGLEKISTDKRNQLNQRAEEELLLEQQYRQNDQSFLPAFAGCFKS